MEAPIRYSTDDPDFDPRLGRRLIVAVDGVEQQQVASYDIEAGFIERAEVGVDGKIVVTTLGNVSIERVQGAITVTLKPEGAA
ncbi:MAG TPA: hypothetical protein VF503_20680 [Sphingobium sp.]|uniref:hypothetical protein n=1 Tax=Sphingobium sp. TaxID=1912891 RepID=UPI002ED0002A